MIAPKLKYKARPEEQRRFRRYDINCSCVIQPKKYPKASVPEPVLTETKDVSSGGLFFFAAAEFPVGTKIDFELQLPLKAAEGKIVALQCLGKITRQTQYEDGIAGYGATIERYEFFRAQNNR